MGSWWEARWQLVQPASGVWDWSQMDSVIANNPGRKIMVVASGDAPPVWVQPANLISNYVVFVTALVERYQGQIAAVEIWNEPSPAKFWNNPDWLKVLADLYIAGSAAIKAVDRVCGCWGHPSPVLDLQTLRQPLPSVGVSTRIDGLTWHDYWAGSRPIKPCCRMAARWRRTFLVAGRRIGKRWGLAVRCSLLKWACLDRVRWAFLLHRFSRVTLAGSSPTPRLGAWHDSGVKCAVMYRAAGPR